MYICINCQILQVIKVLGNRYKYVIRNEEISSAEKLLVKKTIESYNQLLKIKNCCYRTCEQIKESAKPKRQSTLTDIF